MYWQAPSFSIIRLSILILRGAAKLVSDLDPRLQAAIDHLSLVRAFWRKKDRKVSVALGSEPTLAEKRLHFYVLEVGLGEDRNQITCARSHCVCFLMLAGGCQQKTNLTFLVWKARPPECFKIPSDDQCVLPHLLLTATDFQSYNRWKLDPWSLGWESELRTCECNNCQNFIVTIFIVQCYNFHCNKRYNVSLVTIFIVTIYLSYIYIYISQL